MSVIIGFVPSGEFKDISFPVCFNENGDQMETTKGDGHREYALILLDDDRYSDCPIEGNGPVLVVQHNSNSQSWERQINVLSSWNWQPTRIGQFSRFDSTKFWQDVKALLDVSQGRTVKADIIRDMQNEYNKVDILAKIDTLCGWYILNHVSPSEELEDIIRAQSELLTDNILERLNFDGTAQDFLNDAENIVNELMA